MTMTCDQPKPKTIYIAGPMRGVPEYNFPAFDAARDKLKAVGYDVISPADLDRECGFNPLSEREENWPTDAVHACVKRDIDAILACDFIVLLPNWENSIGVAAEVAVARWLRKPVYPIGDIFP